jgi:glycosyltransferase involved in cell wall biosynthesis
MTAGDRLGILHITTFLQGGAGRAVMDLALGQRRRGHHVAVVSSLTDTPGYGNYPEYLERLRDAGVPLVLGDSSFSRDLALNRALAQIICDQLPAGDFDVIHAHAATPVLVGHLLADLTGRRLPIVQTMHGWGSNKTPEQEARDVGLMQRAARVIVTSAASGDQLAALGVPREHLVVIPCGIADATPGGPIPEEFAPVVRARQAGAAVLATIGTVNANKNQELLIEALPRLAASRPVVVAIAGEGPDVARLRARADALGVGGRVFTLGYLPDASRLLPEVDLVVQPSRTEGQGLTVIEAFRARRPVVASDIAPLRELVQDGVTGFLFADNDATALAETIARALSQPPEERAAMLERAYALFSSRYTLSAMLSAHDDLYGRLGAVRSPGPSGPGAGGPAWRSNAP